MWYDAVTEKKVIQMMLCFINSLHTWVPFEGESLSFYSLQLIGKRESNAEDPKDLGREFVRIGVILELLKHVLIV